MPVGPFWIRCVPFSTLDFLFGLTVHALQHVLSNALFFHLPISAHFCSDLGSGEPSGAQGNQRERWFSYIFDFSNVGFTQQTFEVVSRGLEFFKRGSQLRDCPFACSLGI